MNDVRLLSVEEIPLLLPGAREFFATRRLMGELNEAHFVSALKNQSESGIGFVLVCGNPPFRGSIAGAIVRDFATGDPTCLELYWYTCEAERGSVGLRLLKAFEAEATRRGAKRIIMMNLAGDEMDTFAKFYNRCGYRLKEQVFAKEVI